MNPTDTAGLAAGLIEEHIRVRLDPAFLQYYVDVVSRKPPNHTAPIEHVRLHPDRSPIAIDTAHHERVADHVLFSGDGTPFTVRVYHPDPATSGPGPYPVHLNHHGGGFVVGDLISEGQLCLSMRTAGIVVVDVAYRLCPESVWGKCVQDAWAALRWVTDGPGAELLNINPASVSIGGVSAGSHICLILQHLARDAGIPLRLCLASVPPSTDGLAYRSWEDSPFPSFGEFRADPTLPWERIRYLGSHAMPQDRIAELRAMWPDWWLAPIRASNWKGLCDTFIRTAEVDPLRDEGEAYGMKLVAGGAKVTFKRYLGCPHTFMYMPFLKQKDEYDRDAVDALKLAHGLYKD
ncbi:Alpha/Beta hydrolase protein [Echria macrotheca]|uniref:Alpha/Beta hydrolase protein n=1 Tax=Echria macrotheca TaxID=438768 RepID=A0AAJ0BBY2_9PEZI|nr:Alpha/Beta hydrolase protein [Echria macrotheca]